MEFFFFSSWSIIRCPSVMWQKQDLFGPIMRFLKFYFMISQFFFTNRTQKVLYQMLSLFFHSANIEVPADGYCCTRGCGVRRTIEKRCWSWKCVMRQLWSPSSMWHTFALSSLWIFQALIPLKIAWRGLQCLSEAPQGQHTESGRQAGKSQSNMAFWIHACLRGLF